MTPEQIEAGRAALERLKRYAAGELLAHVYPDTLMVLDALRKDLGLVLSALRRRPEA